MKKPEDENLVSDSLEEKKYEPKKNSSKNLRRKVCSVLNEKMVKYRIICK
jgi:hypothetical protein